MKKEVASVNLLDRFVPDFPSPSFLDGFCMNLDSFDENLLFMKADPLLSLSKAEQEEVSLPAQPNRLVKTLSDPIEGILDHFHELRPLPSPDDLINLEELSPSAFPPTSTPTFPLSVPTFLEEQAEDSDMSPSEASESESEEEEPEPLPVLTKGKKAQAASLSKARSANNQSSSSSSSSKSSSTVSSSSSSSPPSFSPGKAGSSFFASSVGPSSPGGGDEQDPRSYLSQKVSSDGVEKPMRKKPGRKPKILDEQTKLERGRLRQEKNRLAAKKCREKKQQFYVDLEQEVEVLRKEKEEMGKEILMLRQELSLLKGNR